MTWLLAVLLALAALGAAALAMRGSRAGLTTVAAALALGLAGYAMQASPNAPGAPAQAAANRSSEAGWSLVEARGEMIADGARSRNRMLLTADAYARQGRYAEAAAMLDGAVAENPRDQEAWLALGNVLVEHAEGALTRPAMLAYRRAADIDSGALGPGYFLGLALIRQGRLGDARGVWASTLASGAPDAAGRAALEERLERLDGLLASGGQIPQAAPE